MSECAWDYTREIDDAREHSTHEPQRPSKHEIRELDADAYRGNEARIARRIAAEDREHAEGTPVCTCIEPGDWWCAVDHTEGSEVSP